VSERLREVSVELEVPFRHVDLLGVVWHGHYLSYMEEARTRLLRGCGLDAGELIGSRMRVSAWLKDLKHRLHIAYEITNLSTGRRAARGHTILATTDAAGNLLLETPDEIQRCLLP
jgi:acyl-CoA thioester hydrolase